MIVSAGGASIVKTIGLIGGVTWESTAEYYKTINQEIAQALGRANSAKLMLVSLNFEDVLSRSKRDEQGHSALYCDAARHLEHSGADFIVICSNTGHRRAKDIQAVVRIPILHIADIVGSTVATARMRRVGLLGTASTMEDTFIREILEQIWHLDLIVPNQDMRLHLDCLIGEEMARGIFSDRARTMVVAAIDRMVHEQGIEGAILGCTELPLLLRNTQLACPSFDTLRLHAIAA